MSYADIKLHLVLWQILPGTLPPCQRHPCPSLSHSSPCSTQSSPGDMIIVIRWQWGHIRPDSWASKWCQYGRRAQNQSPQTEEQWYCLARFVTSSKHWSILEYFTIIEHWSLAGWKLEHWVQISLTITWRAPGSDDVHGGADYHLERFTKIPRVELSVADNVVDWTILKQSRILIILSDHHHNHK